MARRLVVCLDGTGNEIGSGGNLSNVLKLYMCLEKTDDQRVFYDPGVGTIGKPGWWSQLRLRLRNLFGLAFGVGLDDNVLDAYSWLCHTWEEGDGIYLFGFSRGAYTARVLAGFIHMCGLLRPDQLDLCGYALGAYKKAADLDDLEIGFNFGRISGSRRVTIELIGAWDTVASLIVPRRDRFYLPSLQTLPFTRSNPSVRRFRHAIAIDERRRMFRLNHWKDPQDFRRDPSNEALKESQDVRQVWFSGVHADVGGGYPETESALSKYPLLWMIEQARAPEVGLTFRQDRINRLALGINPPDSEYEYVAPDAAGPLHRSLTSVWWPLEGMPKYWSLQEWPRRWALFDFYLPLAEPRPVPNRPWPGRVEPFFVHSSVLDRLARCPGYAPPNLPDRFDVDRTAGPQPEPSIPPDPAPPYRGPGLWARLKTAFLTFPGAGDWGWKVALPLSLLLVASVVLHRLDLVAWDPVAGAALPMLALLAAGTALVEEALFRGALVRQPPDGATALGPMLLSAGLFTAWHPLQAWLYDPCWQSHACDPGFLAGCFLLGAYAAWLLLSTRSIWPAVVFHWGVSVLTFGLYGGDVMNQCRNLLERMGLV